MTEENKPETTLTTEFQRTTAEIEEAAMRLTQQAARQSTQGYRDAMKSFDADQQDRVQLRCA